MDQALWSLITENKDRDVDRIFRKTRLGMVANFSAFALCRSNAITSSKLKSMTRQTIDSLNKDLVELAALLPSISDRKDKLCVYIWLTIANRHIGATYCFTGKMAKHIDKINYITDLLEAAPKAFRLDLILYDLYLDTGLTLLGLKIAKEDHKVNIKAAKKYYDLISRYSIEDKQAVDQNYGKYFDFVLAFGFGDLKTADRRIKQYTCSLLVYYRRYFDEIENNMDKATFYSIQSLKYRIEYDVMWSPAEWICDAVNCAIYCRDTFVPTQADYLLDAAQWMYDKHKDTGTLKGMAGDPTYADDRFVKHLLDISFARKYFCYLMYTQQPLTALHQVTQNPIDIEKRLINPFTVVEINGVDVKLQKVSLAEYENNNEKGKELYKQMKACLKRIEDANLPKWMMKKLLYDGEVEKLKFAQKNCPHLMK